jgi:tetratricopeptide (TPR) repeat protein
MKEWEKARAEGNFSRALALLMRDIERCADVDVLVELLTAAARIQVDDLGDFETGIQTYEAILGQDMFHAPTWDALEALYAMVEDWPKLVWLYEQRDDLTSDPRERIECQLRVAALAEEHLGDLERARKAYERALLVDPRHAEARKRLARLTN